MNSGTPLSSALSPLVLALVNHPENAIPMPKRDGQNGRVKGDTTTHKLMREERKVVTALFADIVGSTALGKRFDPEDVVEEPFGRPPRLLSEGNRGSRTPSRTAGSAC